MSDQPAFEWSSTSLTLPLRIRHRIEEYATSEGIAIAQAIVNGLVALGMDVDESLMNRARARKIKVRSDTEEDPEKRVTVHIRIPSQIYKDAQAFRFARQEPSMTSLYLRGLKELGVDIDPEDFGDHGPWKPRGQRTTENDKP
mgnify:CR=1 FL=1